LALPGWQILRVCVLYVSLCALSLLLLLHYTPLGWQGQSVTTARSSPAYAEHYASMAQQREEALAQVAAQWPQHESGSLAATLLPSWQMQLPPMPPAKAPIAPRSMPPALSAATRSGVRDSRSAPGTDPTAELDPPPSGPPYSLGSSIHLVTWSLGGSSSFASLWNLLGSVALWEPSLLVLVYDLGLTQRQLLQLQCAKNVIVRPFDFDAVDAHIHAGVHGRPSSSRSHSHSNSSDGDAAPLLSPAPYSAVRRLAEGQFQALLLWDALQHASTVLLVDPSLELRQPLAGVLAALRRDGALLVGQGRGARMLVRQTLPATLRALGAAGGAGLGRADLCSADLLGVVRASPLYDLLATPAAQCALRSPQCWAPRGASPDTHRFGQSVFSVLLARSGGTCSRNRALRELDLARCPLRHDRFWPEERGGPTFCVRRTGTGSGGASIFSSAVSFPGPYASPGSVPFWPGCVPSAVALRPEQWLYRVASDSALASGLAVRAPEPPEALALPLPSPAQAEAALAHCMQQHKRRRRSCAHHISSLHASREAQPSLLQRARFHSEQLRTLLLAGLRMPSSYLLCGLLAYALLRHLKGSPWMHRHRHPLLASWTALAIITILAVIAADRGA